MSTRNIIFSFHYWYRFLQYCFWYLLKMTISKWSSLLLLSRVYIIGGGNGSPLQYCLENPRDRGAWWAAVCGVTQSQTQLKRLSSSSKVYLRLLQIRCLTFVVQRTMKAVVQFSRSVVSNSLQPHEPQQARPPCPSPTPGVHPHPCPLSQWCHPTISSSVVPFSSCPQSFPASGSFQVSQLFASGGQSIGVSASTSVPPMNTQDWSPLGWTGWISLQSKGLSRVFSNTTIQKHQFFGAQLYSPTLTSTHDYWKNHSLD